MIGHLVSSILEVDIYALFSDVNLSVGEPSVEMQVVDRKSSCGESVPMNVFGLVTPITYGVLERKRERSLIRNTKADNPW